MIKDFLISFKDNFKEKTRNPFLGTYLIVWLIRNWELVYTLFNFDDSHTLIDKIAFIKKYYTENDFLQNLFINILWAFGLLIATYILLNISRFITNFSEKQLTPWIYKITDSKSIVLKTEYNRVRTERDGIQLRLDQSRESNSKLENRIQKLDSEIAEMSKQSIQELPDFSDLKGNLTTILIEKLEKKELIEAFKRVSVFINKGQYLSNDYEPLNYLIELGLIVFVKDSSRNTSKIYKLTEDGEKVIKELRFK